ncbi:hypothetical protein FB451DRAFT_1235585 [Mycena latifolia]|nr:hypothetical protein FB451DRAFT_1235585 [Mycena latifolia]
MELDVEGEGEVDVACVDAARSLRPHPHPRRASVPYLPHPRPGHRRGHAAWILGVSASCLRTAGGPRPACFRMYRRRGSRAMGMWDAGRKGAWRSGEGRRRKVAVGRMWMVLSPLWTQLSRVLLSLRMWIRRCSPPVAHSSSRHATSCGGSSALRNAAAKTSSCMSDRQRHSVRHPGSWGTGTFTAERRIPSRMRMRGTVLRLRGDLVLLVLALPRILLQLALALPLPFSLPLARLLSLPVLPPLLRNYALVVHLCLVLPADRAHVECEFVHCAGSRNNGTRDTNSDGHVHGSRACRVRIHSLRE